VTTMEIRLEETTTRVTIRPDGEVEVADAAYAVTRISSGIYRVTSGDRRWTVAVAGPAEARWVSVNGRVAVVDTTPATTARRRTKSGGQDSMAAPMPATVVKILVEPGATVAKGDTLLVLEAMKMELPIRAPRDGVVASIACEAGQLVQPGVNLLEFE